MALVVLGSVLRRLPISSAIDLLPSFLPNIVIAFGHNLVSSASIATQLAALVGARSAKAIELLLGLFLPSERQSVPGQPGQTHVCRHDQCADRRPVRDIPSVLVDFLWISALFLHLAFAVWRRKSCPDSASGRYVSEIESRSQFGAWMARHPVVVAIAGGALALPLILGLDAVLRDSARRKSLNIATVSGTIESYAVQSISSGRHPNETDTRR